MNATSRTQGTIAALAFASALAGCLGGGGSGGGGTTATAASAPAAAAGTAAPGTSASAPGTAAPAPTTPVTTPVSMPTAQPTTAGDAVRFLEQTSFGPTEASIQEVMQKGTALALEEQFTKAMSGYGTFPVRDLGFMG